METPIWGLSFRIGCAVGDWWDFVGFHGDSMQTNVYVVLEYGTKMRQHGCRLRAAPDTLSLVLPKRTSKLYTHNHLMHHSHNLIEHG